MATVGTKLTIPFTVGASQIVGQGNNPELWCLYTTDDATDTDPTWTDATSDVRSFSVDRGRADERGEVDAGSATITLDTRDRQFDPTVNAAIRPMNRWWLREQFTGETQDLFVGYAESYEQQWPAMVNDAVAVVNCADEFKVLALNALPVMSPPRDTYEDRIMFDTPQSYWRMNYDGAAGLWQPPVVGHELTGILGAPPASTDSAIAGDVFESTGALRLGPGAALGGVDGDVSGDVSGLNEFAVELWFRTNNTSPAGGDTVVQLPVASGTLPFLNLTGGTLEFKATNSVPTTFTVTSGAISANTWYHVVATIQGGFLRLYLNGSQVASTAWSGSFVAGTPTSTRFILGEFASTATMDFDEVAFYRNGLTATTIAQHYQAGTSRGFRQQASGSRINAVLDSITSAAPRSIQAGTRTVQAVFTNGQSPLEEMRRAQNADSVDAVLFTARNGTITFLADGHRSSSPYNTVQATFDDDGTDLSYHDLSLDYSESFLTNEWNVTRTGGTLQTASDSTSIAKYLKRSQSLTDVPVIQDSDASAIASAMLAKYKDPLTRVTSITLSTAIPAVAEAAFRRDIGDRIEVFRTPPGGGSRIDQVLFIQKIQISGDPYGPWRIVWGVSPV